VEGSLAGTGMDDVCSSLFHSYACSVVPPSPLNSVPMVLDCKIKISELLNCKKQACCVTSCVKSRWGSLVCFADVCFENKEKSQDKECLVAMPSDQQTLYLIWIINNQVTLANRPTLEKLQRWPMPMPRRVSACGGRFL